jgi:YhcH/YjgK/YiaL family protein
MTLAGIITFFGCKTGTDPSTWSAKQTDKWFEKEEWLSGWHVKPDASINRKEFAISYHKNKERWDKTFAFLKNSDLTALEVKRHELDGTNLYAPVSEYITKNEEDARYEAHRKYIDLQYVISGREMIGITPVTDMREMLQEYNDSTDIQFFTVNNIKNYKADPGRFFIFFPGDAHRPNLKEGTNSPVKKIVVKLKVD